MSTAEQTATLPEGQTVERRNEFKHPLPIGFRILSVAGETDNDGESDRETGPNAVGRVISQQFIPGQGWTYGVVFEPSQVWVHIDEADGIDDPHKYGPGSLSNADYVKSGGTVCPFCRSEDISGTSVEIDAGVASQEMSCNVCDKAWTDEYSLTGFRPAADEALQ